LALAVPFSRFSDSGGINSWPIVLRATTNLAAAQ
jgi:hypothetical protein